MTTNLYLGCNIFFYFKEKTFSAENSGARQKQSRDQQDEN